MRISEFICRDDVERAWQMDLHQRIEPVMQRSCGIVFLAFLAALPWLNAWSAIPAAFAAASFGIASVLVNRTGRLDPLVYTWFLTQALIAGVGIINGLGSPGSIGLGLTIMLWPLAGAAGGFPTRLVVVCVIYTCSIYAGAVLALESGLVMHDPPRLIWPLSMFIALSVISTAVRQASMEHRAASVFDPLTGLQNRAALQARVAELEDRARVDGSSVAVIVLDLDRFKRINDLRGHEAGDAVLRGAASRWRAVLGPLEPIYRFGGEEFVAILSGVDGFEARAHAEALRAVIEEAPIDGLAVTVSGGLAVSDHPNAVFNFRETFARADLALYEAKRGGRNCVVVAEHSTSELRKLAA